MEAKMRLLGLLAGLWATGAIAGELSTEVREKRQAEGSFDDRKVVCYYANWAVYRKGDAQFTPQNINPYLCTHLIYAFGGLGKDDTIVPFDEYQDIEKGGYGRFASLKTYNKDLKTMLAIGGWNEGSRRFSPMVEDPARRQVFIKSALRFLRQYNFDGIDLDWEYPTLRAGGRPQDKDNYATFIEEMRQAFESEAQKTGKERLLISMAVPASLEYAGQGYAIDRLDEALDFFNLLTYDYHSAHEPAVNHHSPLYRPDEWSDYDFRKDLNIDTTVRFYVSHGASRHKLVLGIPTYGRSYTLANPDAHEISSPTIGPGEKGEGTKEDGYLAYYEICQKVLEEGWDLVTQYPGIMGPYAHKGDQWVGFDDVDIAVEKAFYVAEEELGGIMFWTIDNDDFRGICSKTPYPLIESAKEAMYSVESTVKTKTSVEVSTSEQVRRTRTKLRLTEKELANLSPSNGTTPNFRKQGVVRPPPPRPKPQPARNSGGRGLQQTSTTPAPPTTPSSGPAFKCRAEGFFPHATSCKKYFWCLDTPNQGMVAHTFSCPQGLFFNEFTDGCDFLRNVNCGDKDTTEVEKSDGTSAETSEASDSDEEEPEEEDPKSLKDILELVKAAGGVEGLEKQIEEEAHAKKKEDDRRQRISTKTRNRLTQLLKGRQRESGLTNSKAQENLENLAREEKTTPSRSARPNFLANLVSRRKGAQSPAPFPKRLPPIPSPPKEIQNLEKSSDPQPTTQAPTTSRSRSLTRKSSFFRNRNINKATTRRVTKAPSTQPSSRPSRPSRTRSSINLFRNRNRQSPFSRATPAPTTTPPPTEETQTTQDPESNKKIQIVGAHLEPEVPEEEPLHLGVFKPKAGIREKLRETLHEVLLVEMASRPTKDEGEDQSTLSPLSTVTISKNTRIEGENIGRARETVRGFASRRREQSLERATTTTEAPSDSNRYVTIQRGRTTTSPPSRPQDKVLLESDPASDPDHEDHADHLASKHSPEIHLRLLHPDQPLEQPRSTADDLTKPPSVPFLPTLETPVPTDSFAPTLPNVSPTEGRISSTTGAVSSTATQRSSTRSSPGSTRSSTGSTRGASTESQPSTSSTAGRGRSRSRSRHRLQPAPTATSEPRQEAPRGSGRGSSRRVVRPRTRTRARLATGQTQETPEVEKEAPEAAASPRGRVISPRRRLTRPRSSAPVFRSGSSSGPSSESPSGSRSGSRASSRSRPHSGTRSRSRVINQRLRIRGGARSTAAPVQVSQVDEIVAEGKVDNGVVTTEKAVVTSEAPVVTINPTVVTTQESSLLTAEDPLVKAEDIVVRFEDDVVVTDQFVVTTENILLISEESTFTTLNDFVDEKSQKPAEVNTETTTAAKVMEVEDKGTDGPSEEVEAEIAVESHEEEISTLRPSKFKPKFGAETRNKLREKLQRQLEESKKKKAGGGDVGSTDPPTSLGNDEEESDPFDSAFSDFDLTSSQQDLLTVKVAAPESRSGRQLAGRSQLKSRGSERRHSEIRGSPRRRRLTQNYANVELHRVGRSTLDQTETQQVTDEEQGKGIFQDLYKEEMGQKTL